MTMLAIIVPALAVVFSALCRLVSRWQDADVVKSANAQALEGCPAKERADIVRASAELASRLRQEPERSSLFEQLLRMLQRK